METNGAGVADVKPSENKSDTTDTSKRSIQATATKKEENTQPKKDADVTSSNSETKKSSSENGEYLLPS